jgi:hypothetical protein
LDVVIVEGGNSFDPFHESSVPEEGGDGEGGYSAASAGGPRPTSRRPEESDSPYKVIWSVLRSIIEIIIDVVI